MRQISQAGRELTQSQVAEVQALSPGPPSLLDSPLRLSQIGLHSCSMLASRAGGQKSLPGINVTNATLFHTSRVAGWGTAEHAEHVPVTLGWVLSTRLAGSVRPDGPVVPFQGETVL